MLLHRDAAYVKSAILPIRNVNLTLQPIDRIVLILKTDHRYFHYHAVPGNEGRLRAFLHEVRRTWLDAHGDEVSGPAGDLGSDSATCCLRLRSNIRIQRSASTPNLQGRNRVRESRQHWTVRGPRVTAVRTPT
jgi:hypothetical protein